MERQRHGLDYEKLIIQKYCLLKSDNYTSKYDAYYKDIPVQIKCIKQGSSIELGDFQRNQLNNKDFILIIGFWKNDKKNIIKEHCLSIDNNLFSEQMKFNHTIDMLSEMKKITNLYEDDLIWKKFCKKYRDLYPLSNNVKLRFKRDHSKQKRIQCAINWKYFNNVLIHSHTPIKLSI